MDLYKRAVNEFKCKYCNVDKGNPCLTPTGRISKNPHVSRQWDVVISDRFKRKS